jgi:hypothetical protein
MTKIFVTTAYSGENEFEACCKSVNSQKGVDVEQYIVKNKPILEAFNEMYQAWESVKHKYDMLIQVDADMIMKDDNQFNYINSAFNNNFNYNYGVFPVQDFFTMTKIWGIACYKPSIQFNVLKDKYAPDGEYNQENRVKIPNSLSMTHVAFHSSMPTLRTAFHYGWHRELRSELKPVMHHHIKNVKVAYEATGDVMRKHVLEGHRAAKKYKKNNDGDISPIEYTSHIFQTTLRAYEEKERKG